MTPEELETLNERVKTLEHGLLIDQQTKIDSLSTDMALITMVFELLEREGISRQECKRHLGMRHRHFRETMLQKLEDINPKMAAHIDTRPIDEFELPTGIEPIFPE